MNKQQIEQWIEGGEYATLFTFLKQNLQGNTDALAELQEFRDTYKKFGVEERKTNKEFRQGLRVFINENLTSKKFSIVPVSKKRILKSFSQKLMHTLGLKKIPFARYFDTLPWVLQQDVNHWETIRYNTKRYIPFMFSATDSDNAERFEINQLIQKILHSGNQYFWFLGESGMGKSLALALLFQQLANKNHDVLFASLYDKEAIEPLWKFDHKQYPHTILVLDAYDERSEAFTEKKQYQHDIETLTANFYKVIIGCRTQYWDGINHIPQLTREQKSYTCFFVPKLTQAQVQTYLQHTYPLGTTEYKQAYQWIFPEHKNVTDLGQQKIMGSLFQRPMILSYIDKLLPKKDQLHNPYMLIMALVRYWRDKEASVVEKRLNIKADLYAHALMAVSERFARSEEQRLHLSQIERKYGDILQQVLHNSSIYDRTLLQDRSLFHIHDEGYLRFSHRTLHEIFVARAVFDGYLGEDAPKIKTMPDAQELYRNMCLARLYTRYQQRCRALGNIPNPYIQFSSGEKAIQMLQPYNQFLSLVQQYAHLFGIPLEDNKFNHTWYLLQSLFNNARMSQQAADFCFRLACEVVDNQGQGLPFQDVNQTLFDELKTLMWIHPDDYRQQWQFVHRSFAEFFRLLHYTRKPDVPISLFRFAYLFAADQIIPLLQQYTTSPFEQDTMFTYNEMKPYFGTGEKYWHYIEKRVAEISNAPLDLTAWHDILQKETLVLKSNAVVTMHLQALLHSYDIQIIPFQTSQWNGKPYTELPKLLEPNDKPDKKRDQQEFLLRPLQGGTFTMGDNNSGYDNEKPAHTVTVSDFCMSVTPVTVAQFAAFINATGYRTTADVEGWAFGLMSPDDKDIGVAYRGCNWTCNPYGQVRGGDEGAHPVIFVSWYDAVVYCNWLSEKYGIAQPYYNIDGNEVSINPEGKGFRLPTEAEWEYAAGGGAMSPAGGGSGGGRTKWAGTNAEADLVNYAWYDKNSENQTHPVAQLEPNPLGLYDMSGNVWEWCQDAYDADFYKQTEGATNPIRDGNADASRVVRGGSWDSDAVYCRIADRYHRAPGYRDIYYGFRLCFVP